jgi:hypothetical protein
MAPARYYLIGLVTATVTVGLWLIGAFAQQTSSAAATAPPRIVCQGLSKNLELVSEEFGKRDDYQCRLAGTVQDMQRITSKKLTFRFTSNPPCDEIVDRGSLIMVWDATVRLNPNPSFFFGKHTGTFDYKDGLGNVASGQLEGTIGCGTHRPPNLGRCEECRERLHFEGTLTGKYTRGPLFDRSNGNAQIQASYAGRLGDWPRIGTATCSLDGVHLLPCQ